MGLRTEAHPARNIVVSAMKNNLVELFIKLRITLQE